jgi:hypothetical protein
MCLNASRTRRRLRRLLEDWNNLGGHAALADAAPGVVAAMEGAGWRWQGLGAEDPQARCCRAATCLEVVMSAHIVPAITPVMACQSVGAVPPMRPLHRLLSMVGPAADANFPHLKILYHMTS